MKTRLIASVLAAASVLCCFSACGDSDENDSSEIRVSKDDIQSANTGASSLYKAVNMSLVELDADDGVIIDYNGWMDISDFCVPTDEVKKNSASRGTKLEEPDNMNLLNYYIHQYFSSIEKLDSAYIYLEDEACLGAVICIDEYTWGTFPGDLIEPSDLKGGKFTKEDAMAKVEAKLEDQ